jgi:hypothetical protein
MTSFKEYIKLLKKHGLIDIKDWAGKKGAEKWLKDLLNNESVIDFLANEPNLPKEKRKQVAKEYFNNCLASYLDPKIKVVSHSKCDCKSHSWQTFIKFLSITNNIFGIENPVEYKSDTLINNISDIFDSYIIYDTGTEAVYILPYWLFHDELTIETPHVLKNHIWEKHLIGTINYDESKIQFNPNIFDISFNSANLEHEHLVDFDNTTMLEYDNHLFSLLAVESSKLLMKINQLPLYSFDIQITTMKKLSDIFGCHVLNFWKLIRTNLKKNRTCTECQSKLKKKRCCADCNLISYCSRECQRKNWKMHRPFCESMKFAKCVLVDLKYMNKI